MICINTRYCIRASIRTYTAELNLIILKIDYYPLKFSVDFIQNIMWHVRP
jgi:hypothetical protein